MNEVKVGACSFGDGSPRVCIPLMGRTREDILEQSKLIVDECHRLDKLYKDYPELRVSVIEWRADYYDDLADSEKLWDILNTLRLLFSDRLLLFTFRSEEEGGELRHDRVGAHLDSVYEKVIESGLVDLIDVEVMRGNYKVVRAATLAHEAGIKVIMSYHNFQKTPHDADIVEILRDMDILGGDILKIAVMPKNEFDVRRLMELQERVVDESFKPVVLISMGETGVISRIKGKETGACMTFASVGEESAPGQIEVADLLALLKNQI